MSEVGTTNRAVGWLPGVPLRTGRCGRSAALAVSWIALALAGGTPTTRGAVRPETVHDTRMEVRWDEENRTITGTQRLRWTNTTSGPVEELRLHLYLNAFANNRSTFMRAGRRSRGEVMPEDGWGYTEVRALRLESLVGSHAVASRDLVGEGGLDLLAGQTFLQPDDGNPDDRTLASYPLPFPVPPGAAIELTIEFQSRMPEVFARSGATGDFILAGQWFPKPAVLEDAGERGRAEPGWSGHQYHATSEFYADFGNYDVTVDLPKRYHGKIGATGKLVEERMSEDRAIARFVQAGVHDFAWTAFPRYEVVHDRFDPESDVPEPRREEVAKILGVNPEALRLQPVEITLFLQPANRYAGPRYLHAVKVGLREMGLHLGAYPYETLTLVDPPRGTPGAAGMEYPTFFTLGAPSLLRLPLLRRVLLPESVTVHEFAHQYFQGQIASNEFEESWLDEGFTQYWEHRMMDAEWGALIRLPGFTLTAEEAGRRSLLARAYSDPVLKPAWEYRTFQSYAFNSYSRPATVLLHLERMLGPERFDRAMRRYFEEWRYRHPSSEDFIATFQRATGEDLDWFFDQAIYSDRKLDYAIRSAETKRLSDPEGWFGEGEDRRELPEEDLEEPREAGPEDDGGDREGEETIWVSEVVAFRYGEFVHPVTVEMVFEDGFTQRETWNGADRWRRWTVRHPSPLEMARVDPDDVLILDADRLNNGVRVEPDPIPRRRFVVEAWLFLQLLFEATGWAG